MNSVKDFSSWLRTITLIRNIIAHHSRLWNRVIITQYSWPKNMENELLDYVPDNTRRKKIFPILIGIIHLNNNISPGHSLIKEIKNLFEAFPKVPIYKMGFPPSWHSQPIFINS